MAYDVYFDEIRERVGGEPSARAFADVMAFIKEISSDGNVNTLDIIFPTFPIYYVTNPDIIRLLLEPVLRYLQAGRWPRE